jgi:hypothetical protein
MLDFWRGARVHEYTCTASEVHIPLGVAKTKEEGSRLPTPDWCPYRAEAVKAVIG